MAILKKILIHLGAVLFFLTITLTYFSPILDGKVLPQGDVMQFQGMSKELKDYYESEGVASVWTGSMFSGMPAYMIGTWGANPNLTDYVEKPLKFIGSTTAGAVFTGMLTAYILFTLLGFGVIPSILGAVAFSFSSYNIIIIEAGHVTKAWAIAYMPLVVGGVLIMFRKKYLTGGLLMAIGLVLQIKSNHLQITYYTGLLCAILYIGFTIRTLIAKDHKGLLKATGILTVAIVLAVLSNTSNFYGNYEMSQESIRGKSELTKPTETEKQSSGLDKDYAFAWSYGKAETLSLLIPNIHGGESGGTLSTSSNVYKQLRANGAQVGKDGVPQMPTYWGDQPFTSGPVYFGAIICFLFVLGMILIRSKVKWLLLVATIFFVFLSWGNNFEIFNDWFFYHFPFYNKFRTVSTALVIPSLTMLIVAIWGIKEFFKDNVNKEKRLEALYISAGITGGLSLLFWIMPDFFFNFTSANDAQWSSQQPEWFYSALLEDRKDLLSADALRSLIFILLATATLWVAAKMKGNSKQLIIIVPAIIAILVLTDLWNVDKRYLNTKDFQKEKNLTAQTFKQSNADKMILEDKSPSYRVLNLNNPFNESGTSYYHKSIGGYHAAKLKRYQELIELHLQSEINEIIQSFQTENIDSIMASFEGLTALNMLNAKYIVYHPDQPPLVNPYRMGNAWFVSGYSFVNTADEEIEALKGLNTGKTAIVDKRFESELSGFTITPDSMASIEMTMYKPDRVTYKSKSNSEQLAVFSEIYYAKGWEAYINGKPAPHFRANWTLRAMRIPAGENEIEFKFIPHGYNTARTVASVSSGLLLLLLIGGIIFLFYRNKDKQVKL